MSETKESITLRANLFNQAQLRPWSFCQLVYKDDAGKYWYGVGFSKVSQPDKWDAGFGVKIARVRAARHIYHQISGKVARYTGE